MRRGCGYYVHFLEEKLGGFDGKWLLEAMEILPLSRTKVFGIYSGPQLAPWILMVVVHVLWKVEGADNELVAGLVCLVEFEAVFVAFLVERLEDRNFPPQQHSYPASFAGDTLNESAFGPEPGVHELGDDGSEHVKVTLHDAEKFFGSALLLANLEALEVAEFGFDGLEQLPAPVLGRAVQQLLQLRLLLLVVRDGLHARPVVESAYSRYQLLLLFLGQPHRRFQLHLRLQLIIASLRHLLV